MKSGETGVFPDEVFVGARSALFLFGAGFLGANDAVWARDASVRSTVVDVDQAKLDEMQPLYPPSWRFVCEDAFAFANGATHRWDVVVADPFTGDASAKCLEQIDLFAKIATDALVVTIGRGVSEPALDGWKQSRLRRTHRADWLVLTR